MNINSLSNNDSNNNDDLEKAFKLFLALKSSTPNSEKNEVIKEQKSNDDLEKAFKLFLALKNSVANNDIHPLQYSTNDTTYKSEVKEEGKMVVNINASNRTIVKPLSIHGNDTDTDIIKEDG